MSCCPKSLATNQTDRIDNTVLTSKPQPQPNQTMKNNPLNQNTNFAPILSQFCG